MIKILCLICALIIEGFAQSDSDETRIVGGRPIDITDAPYQVALQFYGNLFCGGTIVDAKWVLTAAHCMDSKTAHHLSVRVGATFPDRGGQEISVVKIFQHYLYDSDSDDYDFSLLKLKFAITFDETKMKVYLPEQYESQPDGTLCTVSGWGNTQPGRRSARILRSAKVPILNQWYCYMVYSHITQVTDRMICAGYKEGGIDACQGDSGGPLVADNTLVGVVSWGKGCATYPGVYARVSSVRYWIRSVSGI